jgi:pSer/pThr/pTyr-binding forkhead associated (FHA) protein
MSHDRQAIAKITWNDPNTGQKHEYVLGEGATASIGRASSNDIVIIDKHVSRQHAVITFRDGVFVLSDLGSINGCYLNNQRLEQPLPLFAGDEIRLYVPTLRFSVADSNDMNRAMQAGHYITTTLKNGSGKLIVTTGLQEGLMLPLLKPDVTIGRATQRATWDIGLQDPSVSRPHARLLCLEADWFIEDLNSSNGTKVNDKSVDPSSQYKLGDGDIISLGHTLILFRAGAS